MHEHNIIGAPMWVNGYLDVIVWLIVASYLWIAWQFWDARNHTRTQEPNGAGKAKSALGQLVAIFILCAISGYLPREIPMPWQLIAGSHTLLLAFSIWYAHKRQASVIMARLN